MKEGFQHFLRGYRKYQFEIRHVIVLFAVLLLSQLVVLFLNQHSVQNVLVRTQQWYQQDAAERVANLTTTSLELLLEAKTQRRPLTEAEELKIVQDFNVIFSQQFLHQNVQAVCILIRTGETVLALDDGRQLYSYLFEDERMTELMLINHRPAVELYDQVWERMHETEQTQTVLEGQQTFHVFIPFVPRGEFLGAVYMKTTPDLGFITEEVASNLGENAVAYSAMLLIGFFAMFFVSSRTLQERDEAQTQLFEEQKRHLADQIHHEKELAFTRRIYHTHHKAEKIGGFIKEDLKRLVPETIEPVRNRIDKFASFIARVIYDMKYFDPPIQTIRGPLFRTNINAVIEFLIANVFQRNHTNGGPRYVLELDPSFPEVQVNEYVIWEVIEPLIQNSLDHAGVTDLTVTIRTIHDPTNRSQIIIRDNGKGIPKHLLEEDQHGIKRIFREHSSEEGGSERKHSGYGCYLAFEIATQRCGWDLDVSNLPDGGCAFTLTVKREA